MGGGGGLATSCVSCCNCMVKATRVVLMLYFVSLLAREDDVAGTLRHRLCLGGCLEATTSRERSFRRAGYDRGGRPIGWLSTGIVQGSVLRILICCKGDWGTRLQENLQRLG